MNGQPMAADLPVALPDSRTDRLGALFDAHHDRLYRLARRLAPGVDDALDLVQETFLKAVRSPSSFPSGGVDEEAWLGPALANPRPDPCPRAPARAPPDP